MSSLKNGVVFDILANGVPRQVSWTLSPDTAWLVFDRNQNGVIDDGSELFGSSTPLSTGQKAANGFEALAEFDSDHDGLITSRDGRFGLLQVWNDRNHNGVSELGELSSLREVGIQQISLSYHLSRKHDEWGNVFRYRSDVAAGRRPFVRPIYDVLLVTDTGGARPSPCPVGGTRTAGGGK